MSSIKNKNAIRRYSIIIGILNKGIPIRTEDLRFKVTCRMGFSVSKSTIEKDIYCLKNDFDCNIERGTGLGIVLHEKVDFLKRLESYFNIESKNKTGEWKSIKTEKPDDFRSIIGLEMPFESIYACHKEQNLYISDETGESVEITHWHYAFEIPTY